MTDLTTLASAKLYAGVAGDSQDALIASLISGYSDAVRGYCNRDFTVGSYSEILDGRNTSRIMLANNPVRTVVSLTVDGIAIAAQSAIGATGYRFDKNSLTLDGCYFTRGFGNVMVAYTAGYDTVPKDVSQALNEWIGLRYALSDKQGWSSKSLAGETVSLITKDMPDSVKLLLSNYVRVVPG